LNGMNVSSCLFKFEFCSSRCLWVRTIACKYQYHQ
jgi:hypothetical protein